MPGGDDQQHSGTNSSPAHPTTTASTIPVASVSPRRTPTRCQTTRGVVGVGVGHLSEATWERLSAATHQPPPHMAYVETQNMSQHFIRQRRLSGREMAGYSQTTFGNGGGIVDYSSLGKTSSSDVRTSKTSYGNNTNYINVPIGSSSSSSSSSTSMRYANSLDSLDAVTNSIQQARANSFNNSSNVAHFYQVNTTPQPVYQSATMSPRRDTSTEENRSMTYRDPTNTLTSRGFQRTFPLRKSTGSCSRNATPTSSTTTINGANVQNNETSDGESKSDKAKGTNRSWRQSADELTEVSGMSSAFWLSPCRIPNRGNQNQGSVGESFGYSNPYNENESRANHTKLMSSEVVATVSPFRTTRTQPRTVAAPTVPPLDSETQRLRRELMLEQERVQRLSAQLSTNSHVVSAFEHSLANMTDRLTKLTNSSEKKDKELSELRQMIQHLKETSELKGFPAPVRWRSDENVLRDSSSSSNNKNMKGSESDNEGGNSKRDSSGSLRIWRPKKQTWLRSSLSKAFSRNKTHGSILSKETQAKNSQNKEQQYSPPISHQRSVSVSALDDPYVADLQRQLAAKDDILTETRLEALSSASQLQTLRETVAKLKSELKSVQRDNDDLRQRLRSSNSNIATVEPSVAIDDDKVQSSLFANMSVDRGSRDGLRIDVPVIVKVQAGSQYILTKIGYVRMSRRQDWSDSKKWRELDMNVQCVFGLYMARLDPFDRLGLSAEASVERYCFMGRSRQPIHLDTSDTMDIDPEECETPILKTRQIHLSLRSRRSSESRPSIVLDELVFTTLRPKTLLQTFCETLVKTRMGLIIGPKGSGKRFTAHRLAELLTRENNPPSDSDVFRIPFNKYEKDEQRLHLLEEFEMNLSTYRGSSKIMVSIFEDIDLDDETTFERLLLPRIRTVSECSYASATAYIFFTVSNQSQFFKENSLQLARLTLSQADCRIEKSFLGYLLRRKVIEIETETEEANDAMIVAVNWLNRLAIHFEEFCQRVNPENHFSPEAFLNPVLDNTHKFRTWFLDLWNTTIVLNLREVIQGAQAQGSFSNEFEDPVRFVFRTWPWREDAAGLPQALRPVLVQSLNNQSRSRWKSEDSTSKNDDPLLDMLLCLQEATKESPDDLKRGGCGSTPRH